MKIDIKILHSACCAKNSPIKRFIEKTIDKMDLDIEPQIQELKDFEETMMYGTTTFPSIVIDDEVVDFRIVNTEESLSKRILEKITNRITEK